MNHQPLLKLTLCVFISLISLVSSLCVYGQPSGNPIIDAQKLKIALDNLITNPDSTRAQAVLDLVNANSSKPFKSYQDMRDSISKYKNDFGFIDSLLAKVRNEGLVNKVIPQSPDAIISSSATFHASNPLGLPAIDALGSFVAERFKQELEIAFLQRFKEWLENDNAKISEAIRVLLPETKSVLLQNEPYQYTVFLETLKESFRKDLNNMPLNIGVYLGRDPYGLGARTPYYFSALLIYNNIVQLVAGGSVIESFKSLSRDTLLAKGPKEIKSIVYFLSLTSQLLNNPDRPEEWLETAKIKSSLNTVSNIKIFTELYLLKYRPDLEQIMLSQTLNLYQAFIANKHKINIVLDWVKELAASYSAIKKNYETIKNALDQSKPIPGDIVLALENSLIVSFKSFFNLRTLGIQIDASIETTFSSVSLKVKTFTELVINIKEKNYGLALTKAIDMLSTFINDPDAINLVKKYGGFAVSVAKAENKNDMLSALRTAALPVGSYRIKRNSFTNISLNAYAGLGLGLQKFSSNVPAGVEKKNAILGFTAPVGLACSWGYRKREYKDSLNGFSGTIFLSIIDIGAVTAFRLTKDETETLPELKWSNLFAPGAYYVHGFGKSPISVGLGVQYGPQVRSIKNNNAIELPLAWSARLFLTVDIPIFSFYSRTEKKDIKEKLKKKN